MESRFEIPLSIFVPPREDYGLRANTKLSKIALPGGFASALNVPAFISMLREVRTIELFQVSMYRCTHVPGKPPMFGAVSKVPLLVVALWRMRRKRCATGSYGIEKNVVVVVPILLIADSIPAETRML